MASQRSSTTEHDFQDLPPAKIRSAVNKAVRYGDIASLRSLLTMAPKETDQKCLRDSIYFGHDEMAKYLILERTETINSVSDDGISPLYVACQANRLDICKLLISKGANVNHRRTTGGTCLFMASQKGHMDVVKYLIEKGADPLIPTSTQASILPIFIACSHGKFEVAKYLASIPSKLGGTEIFQVLSTENRTLLHGAVQSGDLEICKWLVQNGVMIDHVDSRGYTALLDACGLNFINMAKYFLVECKANPNIFGKLKSISCLHFAAKANNLELVNLLIERGAKLNHQTSNSGTTSLMLASKKGFLDIVQTLVKNGANTSIISKRNGKTALEMAPKTEKVYDFLNFSIPRIFRLKKTLPKMRLLLFSSSNKIRGTQMILILKLICWEMLRDFFSAMEFEQFFSAFLDKSTMGKSHGIPIVFQHWYEKESKMQKTMPNFEIVD